jgi:hypothetical protein
MPELISNYEGRVKNFIYQMVNDPIDLNNQRSRLKLI